MIREEQILTNAERSPEERLAVERNEQTDDGRRQFDASLEERDVQQSRLAGDDLLVVARLRPWHPDVAASVYRRRGHGLCRRQFAQSTRDGRIRAVDQVLQQVTQLGLFLQGTEHVIPDQNHRLIPVNKRWLYAYIFH